MPAVEMPLPDKVKISLGQNIGAPCEPLVKKGDYVKAGQPIGDTDKYISAPVHASVSGTVTEIRKVRSATGGEEQLVYIEADKKQVPWEGIKKPVVTDKESFIKAIRESGLVGLGGAAFPTHVKFAPVNFNQVKTLIVNGAECEPFITSDHRAMLEDTEYILSGALAIMKYDDLDEAYIGIEENKPDAIMKFRKLIEEKGIDNISVVKLKARYPKGAERVLVYEVTGKELGAGMLPADVGCIVSNVSSVGFVGHYLEDGVPLIKRCLTVDGDAVKEPKNVVAPIGAEIKDVIDFCGGYAKEPYKIIMGGPMMGRAVLSDAFGIIKNNNAVLVFSRAVSEPEEETPCINCGRCHRACPFGLLPTGFADAYQRKDIELLKKLKVNECMECGSCSFVCPARRPLCLMNRMDKIMLREAEAKEKEKENEAAGNGNAGGGK